LLLRDTSSGVCMATLGIPGARRILGKHGANLSDEEILRDIETATLLVGLFFKTYPKIREELKTTSQKALNVP
jgi:hypothetical protein